MREGACFFCLASMRTYSFGFFAVSLPEPAMRLLARTVCQTRLLMGHVCACGYNIKLCRTVRGQIHVDVAAGVHLLHFAASVRFRFFCLVQGSCLDMALRGLSLLPLLLMQRPLLAAGGFQFSDLLELDKAQVSVEHSAAAAASNIMEATFCCCQEHGRSR